MFSTGVLHRLRLLPGLHRLRAGPAEDAGTPTMRRRGAFPKPRVPSEASTLGQKTVKDFKSENGNIIEGKVGPLIPYERNNWWRTCLAFRGTVLPHVLARVGILTGLSLGLCFLNESLKENKNFELPALDQLGHTVLGVAVSLLIVFRTQSSNSRFWEARTLWGSLVNSTRSLVRMGAVYAGPADELARLVSAYVLAIKLNLRDESDFTSIRRFVSGRLHDQLKTARNPPTVIARAMSEWVRRRQKEGRIDSITAMAMDHAITELVAAQGGCEKIHLTPLPFVYAGLIKQLLLVYLLTLPFVLIAKMSFAAPLVVAAVSFAMLGIEEAGVEIEDPFGHKPNHLPLDQICENIARDVAQLAEESAS